MILFSIRWKNRIILLTTLVLVGTSSFAQAKECNFLEKLFYIEKKVYKDGDVVKSPMKPEPVIPRVINNIRFQMGMVKSVDRSIVERTPDFLSDYDLLTERRYDNRLGKLTTFFDKDFDTRVYSTLTARANADGSVPLVDQESKGLYLYFHGSGTNKASGANFAYKSTELQKLGYSAMSFDMPFHMDGSMNRSYLRTENFMKMLNDMIEKYRIPGKPVYLAGHSFGPEIVFEYAKRYPHSIDGVVGLSPAAFNSELNSWFMKATSQATEFWGDTKPNNLGSMWGGQVTTESQWNKGNLKFGDPTVENPKLKVIALTGDWEEYAPGPMKANGEPEKASRTYDVCAALKVYMKNILCIKEDGVGHYIFTHKDKYGNDIVMRELLRVTKDSPEAMAAFPENMNTEMKALRAESDSRKLTDIDKLAQRYAREPFFKSWMDQYQGGLDGIKTLVGENNQKGAIELSRQFQTVIQQRDKAMLKNIWNLQTIDPQFFLENQELYSKTFDPVSGKPLNSGDLLVGKYYDYLSTLSAEARQKSQLHVTQEIYEIPKSAVQAAPEDKSIVSSDLKTGKFTVTPPNGLPLSFDMNVPPTEVEVNAAIKTISQLRDMKLHREAQPVVEWVKKWITYKVPKGSQDVVESWNYTPSAEEYFKETHPEP